MRGTLTGMGNRGKLTTVVAAVLLLAGCSAAPADEVETAGTQRSAPQAIEETATPEPTTAPESFEPTSEEAVFLEYIRKPNGNHPDLANFTDAELVGIAGQACAAFDEGKTLDDMNIIEIADDAANAVDVTIASLASQTICKEHDTTAGVTD